MISSYVMDRISSTPQYKAMMVKYDEKIKDE